MSAQPIAAWVARSGAVGTLAATQWPEPRDCWAAWDGQMRRGVVGNLRRMGHSYAAIAVTFRVSRQRVHQLADPSYRYKDPRRPPRKRERKRPAWQRDTGTFSAPD